MVSIPKGRRNPLSEIMMNLRLVFKIPDSRLTLNSLIQGLSDRVGYTSSGKESFPEIHGTILSTPMKALEEKIIAKKLFQEPERYRSNGHQSKPKRLRSSLGTISYRFLQLVDHKENRTSAPLVKALSIPPYDHISEGAMEWAIVLNIHVSYRRATHEALRLKTISFGMGWSIDAVSGAEVILHRTKEGLQQLIEALGPQKYPKAQTYIDNLIRPITTFFRWWLHKGELIPLNTNGIESVFREVCNRIKKVVRRWSDQRLLN